MLKMVLFRNREGQLMYRTTETKGDHAFDPKTIGDNLEYLFACIEDRQQRFEVARQLHPVYGNDPLVPEEAEEFRREEPQKKSWWKRALGEI